MTTTDPRRPALDPPAAGPDTTASADDRGVPAGAVVPRVIGIDLSLTGTGVASSLGWIETVTSQGHASASLGARAARLAELTRSVYELAKDADLVVIEAPAFSRTTGHHHDRSGLWWLVVSALLAFGRPVAEVSPTSLKKYATGKGNASKDAVLLAVARRYPDTEVSNNNEADALVLAAMGARWLGHRIDALPKTHVDAMDKVAWPVLA